MTRPPNDTVYGLAFVLALLLTGCMSNAGPSFSPTKRIDAGEAPQPKPDNPIKVNGRARIDTVSEVVRFKDAETGAVCYAIPGGIQAGSAIHCLSPNEVWK